MSTEVTNKDWYILYKNKTNCEYLQKILQKTGVSYYNATSIVEECDGEQIIRKEYDSIKNLIFIQPCELVHQYLNRIKTDFGLEVIPYNDCMTGNIASVCDEEMQRFIMLCKKEPESIEILKDKFEKFKDKPCVRIKAGPYEGLEGRLVRIRRDRKVVISLGTNAISISGVHFSLLEFI